MINSNILEKVHTTATFLQNVNVFRAKLQTDIPTLFEKSIYQSVFILAIVSHRHLLMGFNHLSSTALQNKTTIV